MNPQPEHTPTPWNYLVKQIRSGSTCIASTSFNATGRGSGLTLFEKIEEDKVNKANASFIVRACNGFEALFETCKESLSNWEHYFKETNDIEVIEHIERLKNAIAKAEGK